MIDSDKYVAEIQLPSSESDWTKDQANALENLLLHETMKKAFKVVVRESQGMYESLADYDLGTPKGVSEATKTQGRIAGINFVIQRLLDLTAGGLEDGV